MARARPLQPSPSAHSVIATASAAYPSIFRIVAQFAESASDILLTAASWMLMQLLDGGMAYAMAMHGIPTGLVDGGSGDLDPSAPPDLSRNSSRPILQVIAATTEGRIRARETVSAPDVAQPCVSANQSARCEPTPGARSIRRTAIIAPTVLLLSKIRQGKARRRAIAELRSLDDRSLRDIGITRGGIGYIARYGARSE
jgi:uncharacterized protein YjiS (DUF1127 family)